MEVVGYVTLLAISGLVVGALARLAIPGPDPMSVLQTLLVGVAGTLIAGLITYYAFDEDRTPGLLMSILCAMVLVFVIRKLRARQLGPAGSRRAGIEPGPLGAGSGVQVRFFPGCLVGSLIASVVLTLLLNLLIRAF